MEANKMTTKGKIGGAVAGAAALIVGLSSIYTLNETQQAVVTAQGKPVRVYVGSFEAGKCDPERVNLVRGWADQHGYKDISVECSQGIGGTGLHTKIPFWENVVKLPDQLVEYNSQPETVQTKDKRQLIVDNYSKFYIENPLSYYLKVGGDLNSGIRKLDDIVYSIIRDNIAKQDFNENIRTTDRQVMALDGPVTLDKIEYGREETLKDIIQQSHEAVGNLGMSLVDVRFIKVELPEQNELAVYDRMINERNRIAALYKAEGESENVNIRSNADMVAAQTKANAQQQAGDLLGQGESEAAKIYTSASEKDSGFFSFWRTLKAYDSAYGTPGNTKVILTTDSDFNQELFNAQEPAQK
jgi:modulator of FtsH protease HflC